MTSVRQKMENCINNLLKINGLEMLSQGSIRFKKLHQEVETNENTIWSPWESQIQKLYEITTIIDETKDEKCPENAKNVENTV